jgi:hypothetical protein
MYPEMLRSVVLWPTYGNHDGHSADSQSQSGPYYDVFSLPRAGEAGVAAIPPSVFYNDPGSVNGLVRFAFCKDEATLEEAVARITAFA